MEGVRGGARAKGIGHLVSFVKEVSAVVLVLLVACLHVGERVAITALGLVAVHQRHSHTEALAVGHQLRIPSFPPLASLATYHEGTGVAGEDHQEAVGTGNFFQGLRTAANVLHLHFGSRQRRADLEVREFMCRHREQAEGSEGSDLDEHGSGRMDLGYEGTYGCMEVRMPERTAGQVATSTHLCRPCIWNT